MKNSIILIKKKKSYGHNSNMVGYCRQAEAEPKSN